MISKIHRFWARPWFEQCWFLPAWCLLGLARLTVLTIPVARFAPWLGEHRGAAALSLLPTLAQRQRALQIGRIIRSAAGYTPWDSNCFAQALVARMLLRRYAIPHVIFFGVGRQGIKAGSLEAHAWVTAGAEAVTGRHSFGAYAVVGCFASFTPELESPGDSCR